MHTPKCIQHHIDLFIYIHLTIHTFLTIKIAQTKTIQKPRIKYNKYFQPCIARVDHYPAGIKLCGHDGPNVGISLQLLVSYPCTIIANIVIFYS